MDGMMEFDGNTCTMIVETLSLLKVNPKKSYVGMLFNDTEEVHTFYINYARVRKVWHHQAELGHGIGWELEVFYISVFKGCNTSNTR